MSTTGSHNIRPRDPVHLLHIQHSQKTAYHPQSNRMVEHFHRRLKDALCARCAAANWVDHLPWVLVGLLAAAREDDGTTPAQAVFGLPLILRGQILDSPELPSKDFLEQFSKTLSAAEHPSTRHNTAATHYCSCLMTLPAHRRCSWGRTATYRHSTVLRPLSHPSPLPASLHAAHRRQRGQGVHSQAQTLHRPDRSTCAAQGQGPPAQWHPLPGFPPARGRCGQQGTFHPTATSRTAQELFPPWVFARPAAVLRHSARLQPPSAIQIRTLGLRHRGLGGALWRLITAPSQAKLVPPPPHAITAHARGGSSHTCEILAVSTPTWNTCTVLYCLS